MKRQWTEAELDTHWALTAQEEALLVGRSGHGRFGFVVLLKFFQYEGFYAQIHENFRMRFSSPFQQLLTILAQHAIRPKMPVKGLPRDSQLLA